jgi:pimeloyl-ACP methyl ester carboxylesterase
LVVIDQGPELAPFAELVQRLAPELCGPGFADAWQQFERSLALERIPEPVRSLVLDTRVVRQDVVVGYWAQLMEDDPAELQASADSLIPRVEVPGLGVFGRPATGGERERFERLTDFHLEEWSGDGHFVHLVEADRFAARLLRFVDHCSGSA